jgi:beta-galactosidase
LAHSSYPAHAITQSESFPATIYEDWKLMQDNPWFVGNWVWAAWDYIGEAGCGATPFGPTYQVASAYALAAVGGAVGYPWYQDFQGDLDLIGQRKPQNFWRSVVYGQSQIEMLVERPPPPGTNQYAALWGYYDELESWTWNVLPAQILKVHVYTSGDSVKLMLNGSAVATNSVAETDGRMTTFSVPYSPGVLTAIAYKSGSEIGRKTLSTTGAPAGIRLTSDVKSLTTSRDDLSHVLVEVIDAKGQRVPDAVVKVSFAVRGAGELAGTANGNPHNVDSFKQPRRYTWHGQALAVLRPAKTSGTLTLTASSEGLAPATLRLPVTRAASSRPHKRHHRSHSHKRHHRAHPKKRHAARGASVASLGGVPALILALGAAVLRRRMQDRPQ